MSGVRLFQRRIALPLAHGAWSWWVFPFVVGLAAARAVPGDVGILFLTALASFLVHHPVTVAVKARSGRGPRADLRPALVWTAFYGAVALAGVIVLVLRGHTRFVYLALPGLPVFLWHLVLVSRRAERRQWLVEILAALVLCLWAPAAYWVAGGDRYPEPWFLWWITGLQASGAILTVYLRLEQRRGAPVTGRRTILFHGAALALMTALAATLQVPFLVVPAFVLGLVDALWIARHPSRSVMPRQIGFRQLAVTALFTLLVVIAYLIGSGSA